MLKKEIIAYLEQRGADVVGFAAAKAWDQDDRVPESYRPTALWPAVQSVIVLGIQMLLPIVETTPSVQHRDLYNTCNRRLDDMALDLASWLNRQGHASVPLSRDGYANINILIEGGLRAAFSHTMAAWRAGLGTIGINNTILTRPFGPRVRFVSIFTTAKLPADNPMEESLCVRCGACSQFCPVDALPVTGDELKDRSLAVAHYNRLACARWARALTRHGCYPCGICIKVCPVGEDRSLYGREKALHHYKNELDCVPGECDDPLHASWMHQRLHGSSLLRGSGESSQSFGDQLRKLAATIREEQ